MQAVIKPEDYKTDALIKCVCCRQMVGNTFLNSGSSQQYEQVIEIICHHKDRKTHKQN